MNDGELDDLLRLQAAPERSPEYWEKFPERISSEIRQADRLDAVDPVVSPIWRLLFPLAVACVVAGFLWGKWHRPEDGFSVAELERHEKIYREVSGVFPDQVRAILIGEEGVRLELKETAEPPSSMPILLKTCGADGCRVIISFSGQNFPLNGEDVELLVTAEKDVLLLASGDVWESTAEPRGFLGYQVLAQPLREL